VGDRIEEVILFGSTARGEATVASDVDLLVITSEEDFRLRRNLIGLAYDILLETGVNLSVKVLSRDDAERFLEEIREKIRLLTFPSSE